MAYFDHNATTPVDGRVLEAMLPFLGRFYGNPSALYRMGRLAKTAIDSAREQVAALVDAEPGQVVFTSGGTEANNLALAQVAPPACLAVSAIEHPSVSEPAQRHGAQGGHLLTLPVDGGGQVALAAIDAAMAANPALVSIMLANNETGVIQDLAALARPLRGRGIAVHSDAVQAAGKIPVSIRALGVDMLSLSSHKLYGPKGCGALVVAHDAQVRPLLLGGGQERGWRPGTENVAAIVGFGKAAELARQELAQRGAHLLRLRQRLEQGLKALDGVVIFAEHCQRLPNTVQFGKHGVDGEMLLMRLDQHGVAVSSGSACASGGGRPSQVLTAMAVAPALAKSAIRLSLGQANTDHDIDQLLNLLNTLLGQ